MSFNRWAKRIDANQEAVISALEAAGAQVDIVGRPLDLLVGKWGKFMFMEVKNPNVPKADRQLTAGQEKFFKRWEGYPICMVDSPEAAIRMLNVLTGEKNDRIGTN
jgi:hypothetical protein